MNTLASSTSVFLSFQDPVWGHASTSLAVWVVWSVWSVESVHPWLDELLSLSVSLCSSPLSPDIWSYYSLFLIAFLFKIVWQKALIAKYMNTFFFSSYGIENWILEDIFGESTQRVIRKLQSVHSLMKGRLIQRNRWEGKQSSSLTSVSSPNSNLFWKQCTTALKSNKESQVLVHFLGTWMTFARLKSKQNEIRQDWKEEKLDAT